MSKILTVTKKELWGYFATPTALIFLATYLFISLFTFFWIEKFFTRNIADLRPLFEMMPLLMIFLVSTLTMKMWSEEKRIGTVEFLMTLPVKTYELVLGKFLACMALVSLALLLTLGLVFSVGALGNIDWGPVWGAYFASLLLAAAYTSIGLYVSSRTESQIISLILTALLCLVFYVIGSDIIVGFLSNKQGEVLKLFGSGSRFASISRGILDLRDIYYYVSLSAAFLALNVFALEKAQWSFAETIKTHKVKSSFVALLIVNVLFANFWLHGVNRFRWDMTEKKLYSISDATKDVLTQLQEPLLIRGYFSERTHPLLAPLVPMINDLVKEYKLVAKDLIQTEIVDPRENEDIEAEANRKYNIEPVPFQIADRHSASLVNSYFNIVIQYGDQFEVLNFGDLIEVKHDGMKQPEVRLRNLEYDITSRIKKVMHGFNNTDNLFASLKKPVNFVGYVSEGILPEKLEKLTTDIKKSLEEYKVNSKGKLNVTFLDPSKNPEIAQEIASNYGFSPQSMSLMSQETFYFYLTVQDGDKIFALGVPDDFEVSSFNRDMDATLKRLAPGFLRTVGIYTPPSAAMNPMFAQYGMQQPQGKQFNAIQKKLGENYRTESVDLDSGVVDTEIDTLLIVAPKDLNDKQLFAIDQYLMKGASVILVTSPVSVNKQREGFSSEKYNSGLTEWLAHHGVSIPDELVLDEKNSGFPAVRKRNIQGVTIREPYLAPYPFFIDVRNQGLNEDLAITSGLGQVTLAWASPIVLDNEKNKSRTVTSLINSSSESWRSSDISIEPNRAVYPKYGFAIPDTKESSLLAVMIEGEFESYYKGKESPLIQKEEENKKDEVEGEAKGEEKEEAEKDFGVVTSVIEKSPKISRLMVYASNEFIADDTLQISGMLSGSQYLNSLQLVENSLDWSVQDRSLLIMRSRGHFARTLVSLTDDQKRNWEFLNYLFALLGLFGVYLTYRFLQRRVNKRYEKLNLA